MVWMEDMNLLGWRSMWCSSANPILDGKMWTLLYENDGYDVFVLPESSLNKMFLE